MNDSPWGKKTNYVWLPEWDKTMDEKARVVLFRKKFQLDEIPDKAIAKITADSRYRLKVNGKDVCCGPCKGDGYVWYYEEVDLAPYMGIGENVISVKVLRYPMESGKGNLSVFRTKTPFLYINGTLEFAVGKTAGVSHLMEKNIDISTDESWHCMLDSGIEILAENEFSRYLWNKELVDGKKALHGWEEAGFADNSWERACCYTSGEIPHGISPRNLVKRPIPLLPEITRRFQKTFYVRSSSVGKTCWEGLILQDQPVKLEANTCHVIEFDAGELTTGYYEIYLMGGQDTKIDILAAEAYSIKGDDGKYIKGNREDAVNGELAGYQDTYFAAGIGTGAEPECYSPFWFKTFRFIRLTILTKEEPVTLSRLLYRETGYPLSVQTRVKTSDPQLERIWDISLRTLRRCMHETYEDCPFYEQLQYAMDTRTQIIFTYCVSADDRLARKCMDDFHRSLRPDGLTNCCYPSTGVNLIPGFSLYYIFMIYDHMMYYGDKVLIKKYFLTVLRILEFFEEHILPNGLVGKTGGYNGEEGYWSFIDWADGWKWGVPNSVLQGPVTMESMLYLCALQKTAAMAEFIEIPDVALRYRNRAGLLADAIKHNCYDPVKHLFQDGPGYSLDYSQHCQVFAVITGIVKGKEALELIKRMFQTPGLAKCTVAMSYYLFRGMEIAGCYDEETKGLWDPWREMLANNMTTCVERPGKSRSDCHAWGAAALYEIPSVILGVKPVLPGYAAAEICPSPAFLEGAEGTVITPRGFITVKWEKKADKIFVQYDASGFKGNILLPEADGKFMYDIKAAENHL